MSLPMGWTFLPKNSFRKIIAGSLAEDQVVLISTHQVKDLDSLIDYVLIMEDKKIIIQAPVDTITEKLVFRAGDGLAGSCCPHL